MRILLIDNETNPAAQVLQCLRENDFEVESTSDPKELLTRASKSGFNALLINLREALGSRLGLVEELRSQKVQTPVLGFSQNGSVENLIAALDKGCDDYLGKSFSTMEMLARLKALIRRSASAQETTTLVAGDISIDLLKRQVTREAKPVELQPREFAMLEFMMRNPNIPLSKLQIMQSVWNYNFDPQTNIVDVLICRLRSKIDTGFATPVIQTVRGVGYLFTPTGE